MALSGTYTPNVPQGNQQINNTQQPIETNFQDIAQLFAVNHVPFNTANDFGKHFNVSFNNQINDPSPVAAAISLYSKAVSNDPNQSELFYEYPNATVFQLSTSGSAGTSSSSSSSSSGVGNGAIIYSALPTPGYTGYQYLSGGLLMKFGLAYSYIPATQGANPTTLSFAFPVDPNIPAFTITPFNMQVGIQRGNTPGTAGSYSTIANCIATSATHYQFYQRGPYAGGYFYWLAIGI